MIASSGSASWGSGPAAPFPAAPLPAARFWQPSFGNRWAWIAITLLAFAAWWPLGLVTLALLIGSGRMCGSRRWRRNNGHDNAPWSAWAERFSACAPGPRSSGNRAFDEYRMDTLRRLEEEQRDFASFLERLRFAKDKSEFDSFMAERRQRPTEPPAEPTAPA